jgi:hypothetical protein
LNFLPPDCRTPFNPDASELERIPAVQAGESWSDASPNELESSSLVRASGINLAAITRRDASSNQRLKRAAIRTDRATRHGTWAREPTVIDGPEGEFDMRFRVLSGLFAGAGMLLILAAPPMARGDVQETGSLTRNTIDEEPATSPATTNTTWDKTRTLHPGRPEQVPFNEEATPPVPEPATITLVSLGLLALGAASRRRRAARNDDAPAGLEGNRSQ